MNPNLQPYVAPRASVNDTLDNAHSLEKKLGVLGIGSTGIIAIAVTAAGANLPDAQESDLLSFGADPKVDKLNLFVVDVRGDEHNVAGLNRWLSQPDVVDGVAMLMSEFYGAAQSTSAYLRALSTIPSVVQALKTALS